MSQLSKAYERSGLKAFYNKNKSTILNTAATAAALYGANAAAGAGLLGTGAAASGVGAGTMLGLTAAGAGMGLSQDKARRDRQRAANYQAAQEAARQEGKGKVEEDINAIVGTPLPVVPGPGGEPIPNPGVQPPVNPGDPQPPIGEPDLPPTTPPEIGNGGLVPGTGQGAIDAQKLLDEAKAAYNMRTQNLGTLQTTRQEQMKKLSELLATQAESQMSDLSPAVYEDLNSRGLLRSSALGDRMATEKGKITRDISQQLAMQDLANQQEYAGQFNNIGEQYLSGREGGINRQFSLEDYARQLKASMDLGQAVAPMQQYQAGGKGEGMASAAAASSIASSISGGKGGGSSSSSSNSPFIN